MFDESFWRDICGAAAEWEECLLGPYRIVEELWPEGKSYL